MRTRYLNHSVYRLQYHIVWATKYRRPFLVKGIEKEFLKNLYETAQKYPTLHIFAANTDRDHVHIQIEFPPSIDIASVVQKLKAATSQHLRKRFRIIQEIYFGKEGIWSVGYFVSSVGLNESQIRQYIFWQGKLDKPQTMRDAKQSQFKFS